MGILPTQPCIPAQAPELREVDRDLQHLPHNISKHAHPSQHASTLDNRFCHAETDKNGWWLSERQLDRKDSGNYQRFFHKEAAFDTQVDKISKTLAIARQDTQ